MCPAPTRGASYMAAVAADRLPLSARSVVRWTSVL